MTPIPRESTEDLVQNTQPGPGHRLREARLEKRLSVEEVASRLRLDPRLIQALEQDDYGSLPEPAFVRGYLRGYARLLDLPVGPILESYDRHGFTGPGIVADIAKRPQARSSDLPVRAVTVLVVVVLGVFAAMWWGSRDDGPGAPQEAVADLEEETPASAAVLPPLQRGTELLLPPPPTPMEDKDPPPAASGAEGQAEGFANAPPGPETDLPPPASTSMNPGATRNAEGAPATPDAPPLEVTPPVSAGGDPAPQTSAGEARLAIRFPDDSWVEIYDRTGERLFFNLAKAGRTVEVAGESPLRVLLGYARNVEVTYNGQPFDHRPFTSKDVARFSVGGN